MFMSWAGDLRPLLRLVCSWISFLDSCFEHMFFTNSRAFEGVAVWLFDLLVLDASDHTRITVLRLEAIRFVSIRCEGSG